MDRLTSFVESTTARLAASYLAIIMVLSVSFSFVFYNTSAHALDRQLPPAQFFNGPFGDNIVRGSVNYHEFFRQRIEQGRVDLLDKLILLNVLALITGGLLSYYLARRTLEPIEAAMEAQDRFVADASHELRTPLTAILASNEVALRKPQLDLSQAKAVIRSNVEDMTQLKFLSDGLLGLAKQAKTTITTKPVSFQDIASEAMNRVVHVAQVKHIAIEDSVPKIMVLGDTQTLVQAVVAVLDNAIKYSSNKSTIYLEGSAQDKSGYLSIRDNGIGIAQEDLLHIFDRFYRADSARTKSDTSGYGIGLSIAQKIIEQHHGALTVSSAPTKGATFTIELPLA
jgi:two-component system, OmpR family, sensor histidine kinase CiaH